MVSPDTEKVKFSKTVLLEPPVEGWLIQVEKRMKETLRKLLNVCHSANVLPKGMKKEKWVKEYPGQLLITSGQIAWTSYCHTALADVNRGRKNALKAPRRLAYRRAVAADIVLVYPIEDDKPDRRGASLHQARVDIVVQVQDGSSLQDLKCTLCYRRLRAAGSTLTWAVAPRGPPRRQEPQ